MASTIIDSRIFGDMFSDARMRDVWSDENRTAKYLDIERALAKVQGELGIIPKDAADEIVRNCELSQIDWAKLKAKTEQIGYPIIAVVNQINANCRDKLGEYCHWGATTQDITDTAAVLQMREGLALVEQDLDEIGDALATLARKHRDTPVIGRSNLQQATPITFGYKMASILAGIDRHRERLQQLKPRVLMGEFGGASGTLSSLEKGAMETQAGLMKELGLAQPLIEPFAPGRGSSSTMPQKRNPISCLYIHANISVARQHVAALMDAMVADHERSTGPWEIEWVSLPEIFCLMSGALKQTKFILKGLEVDATRMRANIDLTNGLVMSEAVMMGLGPYIGREYAHDLVYDLCREAISKNRPLIEILSEHPEIGRHVTRAQLDAMCDPVNNLGQAGVMVDRVLAARR
jgi:3-carboxy-cis,cis-muconate cycloisomerase